MNCKCEPQKLEIMYMQEILNIAKNALHKQNDNITIHYIKAVRVESLQQRQFSDHTSVLVLAPLSCFAIKGALRLHNPAQTKTISLMLRLDVMHNADLKIR